MNMTDIEYFLKVAELMSFSKAADALYVTQQAVSLHIKHLEDTYSVTLFERRPSLRLTLAGQQLLSAARDIIEREERLLSQFDISSETYQGEISIGLPPNRSTAFVTEFFPLFSKVYPKITLRLEEKTSSNLSAAISRNEIDLALPLRSQYSEQFDTEQFVVHPLEKEDLYLIISDSLLQQYFPEQYPQCKIDFQHGVSLYDFAHLPMFLHPNTSHLHKTIVNKLVRNGTPPLIRIQTSLTSSLLSLCTEGHGIFFSAPMLLKYLYTSDPRGFRRLNVFPVREFQGNREAILIHHRQKFLNTPLLDSIDIIRRLYASHASVMQQLYRSSL